ncbi:MAG: hypothetical protein ABI566_02125 [Pseudolysinimonas sp.]
MAVFAMFAIFLAVIGVMLLIFVGTGIPLLVLGIRRRSGHRSRKSKIAMIVLGIVWGFTTLLLLAIALSFFLPPEWFYPAPGTTGN